MNGIQPIRHRLVVGIIKDLDNAIELVGELLHQNQSPYLPFLMSPSIPPGWIGTMTACALAVIAEVKGIKLMGNTEQSLLPRSDASRADAPHPGMALHPGTLVEKFIDQNPDIFWPLVDTRDDGHSLLLGMQLHHSTISDVERAIVDTVLRYASERVHLLDIR